MKKDPIEVAAYDPQWAEEGLQYAEAVAAALGPLALRVDHVGSTAVPGLAAKNVIDIQALVLRLEDDGIIPAMISAGYRFRDANTYDPPHPESPPALGDDDWRKLYFREAKGGRRLHIHVRRNGAAAARNALLLRDFLRDDAPMRRDYSDFKMALAAKTRKDRDAYQTIKRPFIAISLRAAESWAELTRWVPGAPDAYWRSAE
ncbi:MAG: GrpB family protein [Caulobacterales bacterium]|uniref:GrpB family protein n=1 Tax=Glycocaulis sp. TaxID=1969725 RepID=UPI003FA0EE1D